MIQLYEQPMVQIGIAAKLQKQIVDLGGLDLLLPLTKSESSEVRRLAAHALANLSVNGMSTVVPPLVLS